MPSGRASPFSATGGIELTAPGQGRLAPLAAAREFVPQELYDSVLLFATEDTPGFLTPDQGFTGQLTDSDWEPVQDATVTIAHNSWFTAQVLTLLADSSLNETPLIGLAWGTFDLTKGEDFYQGSYALLIGGPLGGQLVLDSSCAANEALGSTIGAVLGQQVEVRAAIVNLTDRGDFTGGPAAARGIYRRIGSEGTLTVTAEGCLGSEVATFSVTTVREP
ncbi:MAG: hypothetical protein ACE5Q6_15625 [Dehalococcoidia bacterium]